MDEFMIGNQQLDDLRPCLVQGFIPNRRREKLLHGHFLLGADLLNLLFLGLDPLCTFIQRHLVNFVNETKDMRILVILMYTFQRLPPVVKTFL